MMKRISVFVFVALLAGALVYAADTTSSTTSGSTSSTASKTMSKTTSKASSKMTPHVEATVVSVDAAKHQLTASVNGENKMFNLSSHTEYMVNGKKSKAADLKAGDNISIVADSKNNAKVIEIKAAQ